MLEVSTPTNGNGDGGAVGRLGLAQSWPIAAPNRRDRRATSMVSSATTNPCSVANQHAPPLSLNMMHHPLLGLTCISADCMSPRPFISIRWNPGPPGADLCSLRPLSSQ